MNPWHAVPVDESRIEEVFPTVIEIPRRSRNKYELDKEIGLLRLDRVLHGAVHYPANYGFIPRTLAADGDPLDVLVLALEAVHPLTIVEARAIGMMRMQDEKGIDHKIIAASTHDPAFSPYRHHREIPPFMLLEIRKFFEEYKALENKAVLIEDFQGPEEAVAVLREDLARYRNTFPSSA